MTVIRPSEDETMRLELLHDLAELNAEAMKMQRRGFTATHTPAYAAIHAKVNDTLDLLDLLAEMTSSHSG